MNAQKEKTIGIVGGMGPRAGVALLNSLIDQTPANIDQEHLNTLLVSFPKNIADRTSFLEGEVGINPGFEIAAIVKRLIASGAEVIGLACNTSHVPKIFEVVRTEVNKFNNEIKLLNMPGEVGNYLCENYPEVIKIGVMTTNGLYRDGLYKSLLQKLGYESVVPNFDFQNDIIHRMIYDTSIGIKAHSTRITHDAHVLLERALSFFKNQNCGAVILGCTELSLLLNQDKIQGLHIIDSTKCLARALINEAIVTKSKALY